MRLNALKFKLYFILCPVKRNAVQVENILIEGKNFYICKKYFILPSIYIYIYIRCRCKVIFSYKNIIEQFLLEFSKLLETKNSFFDKTLFPKKEEI